MISLLDLILNFIAMKAKEEEKFTNNQIKIGLDLL
jgi:hypothetical protein